VAIPLPPWRWQKANTADLHPHHPASPLAQRSLDLQQSQELLEWIIRFDAATVRERVEAMRRRWPDDSSFALAKRAFDQAGLWVIGAGVVTGLAANPLLGVVGTLADLSITVRTQIFAAACAAELLIPGFLDAETARQELLLPIFGTGVISQVGLELGVKALNTASREVVVKLLKRQGAEIVNRVTARALGRRAMQQGLLTKTLPVLGGLLGGGWNAVEVRLVRDRTLRYLTNHSLDASPVIDVEARPIDSAHKVQQEPFW